MRDPTWCDPLLGPEAALEKVVEAERPQGVFGTIRNLFVHGSYPTTVRVLAVKKSEKAPNEKAQGQEEQDRWRKALQDLRAMVVTDWGAERYPGQHVIAPRGAATAADELADAEKVRRLQNEVKVLRSHVANLEARLQGLENARVADPQAEPTTPLPALAEAFEIRDAMGVPEFLARYPSAVSLLNDLVAHAKELFGEDTTFAMDVLAPVADRLFVTILTRKGIKEAKPLLRHLERSWFVDSAGSLPISLALEYLVE
jgi:hypothetical protein